MKPLKIAMMSMTHGHTRKYYQTLKDNPKLDWVAVSTANDEVKKVFLDSVDGIPCYDSELIHKIARESGFAEKYIKTAGEYAPDGFLSTVLSTRAYGPTNEDYLWEIQYKIISELAEKESCVIVGRCADYILREKADCLNVFIYACTESSKSKRGSLDNRMVCK